MQNLCERKRLSYLRRYNRLYREHIHRLEEQLEEVNRENEQLRNAIDSKKTYAHKDDIRMMEKEIFFIKKSIETIIEYQDILLDPDGRSENVQREQSIGALHRPYQKSTYTNGLGKEFIIHMHEDHQEKQSKEESSHPEEVKPEKERSKEDTSAIVQQIKATGKKKEERVEQSSRPEVHEQTEKHQRLRSDHVTFRDLQRANHIYSKPSRTMGRTKAIVNRQVPQTDQSKSEQPTLAKQEKKNHPTPKEDVPTHQPTQVNEESEYSPPPSAKHTSSKRNKSSTLKEQSLQRQSPEKGPAEKRKQQPSFLKTLFNKFK